MRNGTRRDLLAAFLGVPAALAAGCGRRAPGLPPGEVVGAGVELGHRLRLGPVPQPGSWEEVEVAVVGAGVAGLSAAWRLARAGESRFVVLELEPAEGGTSRAGSGGVVPYPWGAHYLPAPLEDNAALLALLGEMGVVEGRGPDGRPVYAEEALCRDPQERVFTHGEWFEGLYLRAGASEDDLAQRARFFRAVDRWVAFRDGRGRKAFPLPTAGASDDAELVALDRVSMAEWMVRNGYTSPRLRWQVDYSCRDDYGARPGGVSAWAGLFYFASRRRAPGEPSQPLLSWPEGNGRLVAHLARAARGRVRVGVAARDVNPVEGGVEVTALSARGEVRGYRARQVIFAAPQFVARYVVRPYRDRPPGHLGAFEYGSWMVANLHLSGRPKEGAVPLSWDNVLYDSPSLGYVVATHQRGLDFGPTIFTYYYPLAGSDANAERRRLLQLSRDEWAEVALSDLERAHPDIRGLVTRLDVMRWGHAMVRPRPGLMWGRARREAARPYRGVYWAHSDLSGQALFEEAFDQGVRAAEEVLRDRGRKVEKVG